MSSQRCGKNHVAADTEDAKGSEKAIEKNINDRWDLFNWSQHDAHL